MSRAGFGRDVKTQDDESSVKKPPPSMSGAGFGRDVKTQDDLRHYAPIVLRLLASYYAGIWVFFFLVFVTVLQLFHGYWPRGFFFFLVFVTMF